jgi:hypothetical protein
VPAAGLRPDQERILGLDHPDTLFTRNNIAAWTRRSSTDRAENLETATVCRPGRLADGAAGANWPTASDLDRFKPAIDEILRADLVATGLA